MQPITPIVQTLICILALCVRWYSDLEPAWSTSGKSRFRLSFFQH